MQAQITRESGNSMVFETVNTPTPKVQPGEGVDNPQLFMVLENWENEALHAKHVVMQHDYELFQTGLRL